MILKKGAKVIFCRPPGGDHTWYDQFIGETLTLIQDIDLRRLDAVSYGTRRNGNEIAFMHSWIKPKTSGFGEWIRTKGK